MGRHKLQVTTAIDSRRAKTFTTRTTCFFILSLVPVFVLLLAVMRFAPIAGTSIVRTMLPMFPSAIDPVVRDVIGRMCVASNAVVPLAVLITL